MGNAVRAGLAVLMFIAIALPCLARGQSRRAGIDVSRVIPVHPDVPTILELPDEIEHAQVQHRNEFMIAGAGNRLAVRPLPGTPAGVERLLEVKTRTLHRMFWLRVVARAEDAMREVVVSAAPEPAASAPPALPGAPEPPRSPDVGQASALERAEPTAKSPAAASPPRLALAVHAVVSLGFAAQDLAGYRPKTAFQSHRAAGVRLSREPHDRWWALEACISSEWLAGPTTYEGDARRLLAVSGPWLRAEVGLRARHRGVWSPSALAGLGVQAQLRRTDVFNDQDRLHVTNTMNDGVVLVLGMGLQYRARNVLLGVDFQIRRGAPDSYRSMSALWTVGYFLPGGD